MVLNDVSDLRIYFYLNFCCYKIFECFFIVIGVLFIDDNFMINCFLMKVFNIYGLFFVINIFLKVLLRY